MKVLGISGSLRKGSFNSSLLNIAAQVAPAGIEITIADISAFSVYDEDVYANGFPGAVATFREQINAADGLLIATPEYNYGMSGVIKNAIDWASRNRTEGSLMGKPATIIGAGGRSGTARAQMQLHETLGETGALVMVKPGLQVPAFAPNMFDAEGDLTDEQTRELLNRHMAALVEWTIRIVRPIEFVRYACEMDVAAAAD